MSAIRQTIFNLEYAFDTINLNVPFIATYILPNMPAIFRDMFDTVPHADIIWIQGLSVMR